jgi:type II secretory pathway predicted ATPase ExeA
LYEAQLGLKCRPFSETVIPTAYVAVPSRDAVLRRLRYALERGEGPAVLFGPSGSGKTLLARRLASELPGPAVHLTFPALSPTELLLEIAEEFGGEERAVPNIHTALRQIRSRLAALVARGARPLLVIDDAHLIATPATFDVLQLLLNFATNGAPDLSLLLVGGAEILLDMAPGLADRIAARCLLGPFTEPESATYILGRLSAAGATSAVFSEAALVELHRAAAGLPRRLNRLADLALLIAYAQDQAVADEANVRVAAREFNLDTAA